MNKNASTIKVLILEDNHYDKELIQLELSRNLDSDLVFEWVIEEHDFVRSLRDFEPDIVLSDFNLPCFTGFEALELTKNHDINLPFILITGTSNEEFAAESIKRGAWDYVVKERINRLPVVFKNTLKLKTERLLIQDKKNKLKIFQEQKSLQLKLLWDAIAHTPNSVEIVSSEGTIQYVNAHFEKITGYSSDEVIGKNPNILKSGAHHPTFYKEMWNTILSGQDWKGEIVNRKKNGETFWEETSISPITDQNGNLQYFVAVKSDITERKKAEEELKQSRQIFEILTNESPVGIFRTDVNGKTTYVNPKWIELSGLSFEEALGDGWLKAVHPEDSSVLFENWENEKTPHAEYRFLRTDGSSVWVMGNVVPEYRDQIITGYIGTITDITDRKQLEDSKTKFQKLVEDISDVLFEIDNKLCINYISPVVSKITGFPAEYYIGKSLSEIIYPEDLAQVIERYNELIFSGFSYPIEYRTIDSEGKLIWFRSSSTPNFIEKKFNGIRGIAINVSKQKETEKKLREAKERAEASDKLKTAFMNNISHEIRTPLNGILGFATLLSEPEITDDEKQVYLQVLNASSKRLIQTVTNFMDISLITSKNVEVNKQYFNPGKMLEELRMEYESICDLTGLKLSTSIEPKITTIHIKSDQELILKILKQLLNNAVKFTENGSITIGAEIENKNLRFYIRDTGIGISPEAQETIFERFNQEDASATRKLEGSGLGLSIVKGLTEILGGSIQIDSSKEKGSTFSITIPNIIRKNKSDKKDDSGSNDYKAINANSY